MFMVFGHIQSDRQRKSYVNILANDVIVLPGVMGSIVICEVSTRDGVALC